MYDTGSVAHVVAVALSSAPTSGAYPYLIWPCKTFFRHRFELGAGTTTSATGLVFLVPAALVATSTGLFCHSFTVSASALMASCTWFEGGLGVRVKGAHQYNSLTRSDASFSVDSAATFATNSLRQ